MGIGLREWLRELAKDVPAQSTPAAPTEEPAQKVADEHYKITILEDIQKVIAETLAMEDERDWWEIYNYLAQLIEDLGEEVELEFNEGELEEEV